ncbi:MAG: hypothetical protein FWF37_02110 [Chloroflexi bacterium]|nr:hypothetical protein [Chloroflexota bacterium]
MEELIVRFKELEYGAAALTIRDKNGDYNVYLDPRVSASTRKAAYDHEIRHIQQGHFDSLKSIRQKELEADE